MTRSIQDILDDFGFDVREPCVSSHHRNVALIEQNVCIRLWNTAGLRHRLFRVGAVKQNDVTQDWVKCSSPAGKSSTSATEKLSSGN